MLTDVRRFLVRILLPIAVLTALMIGLGVLITKGLDHLWPFTVEDEVSRDLTADRTPTWDTVSNVFSLLGSTPVIVGLTAVMAGVLRLVFKRWRESLFLIGAVTAQSLVFLFTTLAIDRKRPAVPHLDASPPTSSFPSGHTSAAVALYCGVALLFALRARRGTPSMPWWSILVLIPLGVAVARLYRGMHHPSDVAASLLNGVACLVLMFRAVLARGADWGREHLPKAMPGSGRRLESRS